jgi:hypothetical protein
MGFPTVLDTRVSKATLLRYRFAVPEQLVQHFHVSDGRTLFFYREPKLDLAGGAKVLLSCSFTQLDQEILARGAVVGRMEGSHAGLWLEFADSRVARRLAGAGLRGRHQKRLGCDLMVEIRRANQPFLGRLVDLSLGGAHLAGLSGLQLRDQVDMRLISPPADWPTGLGLAEVTRLDRNEIGVRFLRQAPESRMAITRLFGGLQQAWAAAPIAEHPPICCTNGQFLEPALPHLRGSH